MLVQSTNGFNDNNNTNFKSITGIKCKGKHLRKKPELMQPILEKIVPKKKYNFPGESVRVVAKSKDYSDFGYRMLYGITSDDPLIKYKTVELWFYKNQQGNMFSRAWKYIKGFVAEKFSEKGKYSPTYRAVAPYKVIGSGNSFERAYEDLMDLLDSEVSPSQHFERRRYN